MIAKILIIFVILLMVAGSSAQANCTGQIVHCFDIETDSFIEFQNADTCDEFVDPATNHLRAFAYCSIEDSAEDL